MYLAENIRFLRKKQHMSQNDLANVLGYRSFTTVQKWESGDAEPPLATLMRMTELFGVDLNSLTGLSIKEGKANQISVKVPVYNMFPDDDAEEKGLKITGWEEIPSRKAKNKEYFAMPAPGDRMAQRICKGDVILVRRGDSFKDGNTVLLKAGDEAPYCIRVKKLENGLMLMPANRKYDPVLLTDAEIKAKKIQIIGVVDEVRVRF